MRTYCSVRDSGRVARDEHAVVIVGSGPAGMMLAAELALANVDVVIVERRVSHDLVGSRAGGFHSRTLELLDQRGVADRFLAAGQTAQAVMLAARVLDMSDFPTRHPYSLGLWQNRIETIMAEWISELGVNVIHGREAKGFTQDADGVDVTLADGGRLRGRYLVGCDGGRSLVRKAAGIEFPGSEASASKLIAEVELTDEPPRGIRHDAIGVHGLHTMEDGVTVRVVVSERQLQTGGEPTLRELSDALIAVYGTDFGAHAPTWISRFTDATRQAASYRAGRVLLAGDAAHVHSPAGGQGIGLGVQDAVNLGWKLAEVVNGIAPESLLDTYEAERHPVTARALEHTMAQTALQRGDDRSRALASVVAELAGMDEPRRLLAGIVSGLDVRYDLGGSDTSPSGGSDPDDSGGSDGTDGTRSHPLLGRRMPDLDLATDRGPLRVFELLHAARPLLLNLGAPGSIELGGWANRVQLLDARYDGVWELPVLGAVSSPSAALVRPDGHVAWVGEGDGGGLEDALRRWFGPAQR